MYRINGITLYAPSDGVPLTEATAPSSHSIAPSQPSIIQTIGGSIAIEPPSGRVNVHSWQYDQRSSAAVGAIRDAIGATPLVVIDTYSEADELLTDIVCLVAWPEIKSAGKRNMVDSFTLVFTEISPSS